MYTQLKVSLFGYTYDAKELTPSRYKNWLNSYKEFNQENGLDDIHVVYLGEEGWCGNYRQKRIGLPKDIDKKSISFVNGYPHYNGTPCEVHNFMLHTS